MEFLISLIVGGIAVAALVKAANMSDRMRRIEERFALLERRLASGAAMPAAAAPGAAPAPPPEPTQTEIKEQVEAIPEQFRDEPTVAAQPETAQTEPETAT